MKDQTAERDAVRRCDKCGGPATREGWAFPAGGSFPVTGCEPCLAELAQDMSVSVRVIPPGEGA